MAKGRIKSRLALLGLAAVITLSAVGSVRDWKENRQSVAHYHYNGYVEAFAFDRNNNGEVDELKIYAGGSQKTVGPNDLDFSHLMRGYFSGYKAEK